jgi:CMP-N,N'-diacetyllegionaminic acid synthase
VGAQPEILSLIPARGGSKGIPRKNLMPIAGKPLIAWSIEQALACPRITRVIVSTDDEEIAAVAAAHGADVPFRRPAELAQDLSPDIDAFRHALDWLTEHERYECELVVHLRPTGPVRKVGWITAAIDRILSFPEADSLRSVSWPMQTPYKMWRIEDGWLTPCLRVPGLAEPYSMPRQMLPEIYWQNGYVDIVRPRIIRTGRMAGDRVLPFVVEEPVYEIDYSEDLPAVEEALLGVEVCSSAAAPHRRVKRYPV